MRGAANSSASLVRNLFLTFLLFGTYIAVTIGATTDEQLLRISPVNLPILNVDLPIVAFYTLVPWGGWWPAQFNTAIGLWRTRR